MNINIEESKWAEVANLIDSTKDWVVNPIWHQEFLHNPYEYVSYLSKCKFALKIATIQNGNVLELNCRHAMGATIIAEKAAHYVGVEDENIIKDLPINLIKPKFQFNSYHQLESFYEIEGYFNTILALNEGSFLYDISNVGDILKFLDRHGKFLLVIKPEQEKIQAIQKIMEGKFIFNTTFSFYNEIMQGGLYSNADYIAFLGCSKIEG